MDLKIFARIFVFLFFALAGLAQAVQASISVDGLVGDWGIAPAAYGSSDWTPGSGIYAQVEDQNPAIDHVVPGYGGQKFDVEAILFTKDQTFAYFAVISGFPLEGRYYQNLQYYAGDVAFDFGADGTYEFGLETAGDLNGSKIGELFRDAGWKNPDYYGVCSPYRLISGISAGLSTFAYDKTTYANYEHYVFEFAIPISSFGSFWSDPQSIPEFNVHWTMSCGNDCAKLQVPYVPHVPEPSSLIFMSIGLAGLALKRCKF